MVGAAQSAAAVVAAVGQATIYDRAGHQREGHYKAIGAVARHLAEATYWILSKEESYREPQWRAAASTKA